MLARLIVMIGLAGLAACAGLEPAGRNAARAPPPPAAAEPAPAPQPATPASAAAPVAAPDIAAPAPAPRAQASREGDDEIVIPGQRERQVPPPGGDPRSRAERMEDIRAWDQCVTGVQAAFESDPMRPQMESPEEVCAGSLEMAGRDAVPESRRR